MSGILTKGLRIAENFLEDVDRQAAGRRAGPDNADNALASRDRDRALEVQIDELHSQLAEQREAISSLRKQLADCDASALQAAQHDAGAGQAAAREATALLERERLAQAAITSRLREELSSAETSNDALKSDMSLQQAGARRREMQLEGEVEALSRKLEMCRDVPMEDTLHTQPQNDGHAHLARALEAALQEERRRYLEASGELLPLRLSLSEANAQLTMRDAQVLQLQNDLATQRKELLSLRASFSPEAVRANEQRVINLVATLSTSEEEKARLVSDSKANRHLVAELRSQLADVRSRAEDLESRGSSAELKVGATVGKVSLTKGGTGITGLLDGAFVLAGRLISRSIRARVVIGIYLCSLHCWCLYLLAFHTHALTHGQHEGQ